ncbi:hypothetical protein [Catellatospora sp. NPDC049609]|uniref:hypothetical protein n=1 Tax=Catellatospora sp. NPDC049609 TaxID=3155505 RepID=UPI0034167896
MILVGDAVRHAAYERALCRGHGYESRLDVFYQGQQIDSLSLADDLAGGRVEVTARNRERRTLRLTAAQRRWPVAAASALSPYGVWGQAWVTITAGTVRFPDIPVWAGKLLTTGRVRWSGQVTVTGVDPMWQINREPFEVLRPAPRGMEVVSAILMLLQEVLPDATLDDRTGSTATIPAATAWDAGAGSRGKTIDELAASIGAELYAEPWAVAPGGQFVLRPVPTLLDTPAWVLPDGLESVVEADTQLQSGATVVNRWIVTSERTDRPLIREVVTDSDPASPTRYGGPMGRLTDFYSSPLISDNGQARAAGQAKLARSIGSARARTVRVIANPALEAGDVIAIGVDGEAPEYHLADSFDVPLSPDPASMSISTRSVGGTE